MRDAGLVKVGAGLMPAKARVESNGLALRLHPQKLRAAKGRHALDLLHDAASKTLATTHR